MDIISIVLKTEFYFKIIILIYADLTKKLSW